MADFNRDIPGQLKPSTGRGLYAIALLLVLIVASQITCVTWLSIRLNRAEMTMDRFDFKHNQRLSHIQSEMKQMKQKMELLDKTVKMAAETIQTVPMNGRLEPRREDMVGREIISGSSCVSLGDLLQHVKGLQGPPGQPGPSGTPGLPGRAGRDAVNLIATEKHINNTITSRIKLEMDKVELAAKNVPQLAGAVYVRWGREVCPSHSSLLYKGRAAGTHHTIQGGSSRYICLPDDPEYSKYSAASIPGLLAGVEYQEPSEMPGNLQDHNGPCALCQASNRAQQIMIPAKVRCPDSSWTLEYFGYLMSSATTYDSYSHHRTEYICVDSAATGVAGQIKDTNGALWYHQGVDCNTLGHCPPYYSDRQLACVVCSQ